MNKVVHFEVPTKNLTRAKKFYQDVFGWKLIDIPGMGYTIIHTVEVDENQMPKECGAINGGFTENDPTAKGVVIVINVDSIDSHIEKIKNEGGKVVMQKSKVGDMGLYARVEDTEGNVIGIWEDVKKN